MGKEEKLVFGITITGMTAETCVLVTEHLSNLNKIEQSELVQAKRCQPQKETKTKYQ